MIKSTLWELCERREYPESLVLAFIFSITDGALSSCFLQSFWGFTEASLGSEELQRFFSFGTCWSILEHSGSGSYQPWLEWECRN